ncbi:hypothetical protein [Actinokineospora diospyrosa]|uniref:Uncharacterized protein n=1 Tax=Actinokineospora diospyrosa TaxID=103728 RepID=A0ABT1I6E4_9PSEU|nr:hypothetical protein [Actinokineospora diospyrosa]MCP2268179.1 hypothetical protein [Actinokineospora diospyrosa]
MSVDTRWEKAIKDAIESLARKQGDWVGMVDLRRILDGRGTSRAAQDSHLKRLSAARKLHLAPESNRKALRDRHHEAAVTVGGEPCHIVAWDYHQ